MKIKIVYVLLSILQFNARLLASRFNTVSPIEEKNLAGKLFGGAYSWRCCENLSRMLVQYKNDVMWLLKFRLRRWTKIE